MRCVLAVLVGCLATRCLFMRDPLDPLGALDHRAVGAFGQVESEARSRGAYERARERVAAVEPGMSVAEAEVAMGAMVVTERGENGDDESRRPRKKIIEGWLCRVDPSPLRRRWLFGYDEDGVELIGFAVEFGRDAPEDEDWVVRWVDREPKEDCPEGGGGA